MFKKAAMFGMDARIALAIFGSLSLISGASLYSTIKTVKAEKFHQYLKEVVKATEQHHLDTGDFLEIENSGFSILYINDLVENRKSLASWDGPYVTDPVTIRDGYLRTAMTKQINSDALMEIVLRKSGEWYFNAAKTDNMCTTFNNNCAQWISLNPFHSTEKTNFLQLFNDMDELIDGSDGQLLGNVRYNQYGAGTILYRGINQQRDI
jgi:hypothetical protein